MILVVKLIVDFKKNLYKNISYNLISLLEFFIDIF